MKKQSWLGIILMISMLLVVSACSSNAAKNNNLTFATGTTTGVFYPLGALLSTHWTNETEIRVSPQGSNGSVENLNLMKRGEADLALQL